MQLLLLSLVGLYGVVMLRFWWAWKQMPRVKVPPDFSPQTLVTVIIPVRNEADSILTLLQNLANQNYPLSLIEILVVDDHSEDKTAEIVEAFKTSSTLNIKLISLANINAGFGKKAAIKTGVTQATGELLVFTDGDCQVQPNWLRSFAYVYSSRKAKFISGPVCFNNTHTLFQKLQLVEFAGLIGVGGSSINLGSPNMCNGANLAYPKNIFEEVNGFAGNEHIASGDDEFLLHKVHKLYPESVYFLKAQEATVYTVAKTSLKDFFAQRIRWAGKWPAYTDIKVKLLALLVFGVNFLLFVSAVCCAFQYFSYKVFVIALALKLIADLLFLNPVLHFFQKQNYLLYALPLQLVNIPYVVLTAIKGLKGSYKWKGRNIINKPAPESV